MVWGPGAKALNPLVTSNIIGVGTGVTIQQTTQAAKAAQVVSMLDTLINIIPVQAGIMVGVIGRVNPFRFLRTMKEAMAFVFATCSSVATIPLNLECTKRLREFRALGW